MKNAIERLEKYDSGKIVEYVKKYFSPTSVAERLIEKYKECLV
jgi:hypothetical protein